MNGPMEYDDTTVTSRRSVLTAAGGIGIVGAAAALGGCGTYDSTQPPPPPPPPPPPQQKPPATTAGGGGGAGGGDVADALAKTGDIPVGGGKIFADQQVVVTQPEPGTFLGFNTTCTHQGCAVTSVAGGTINCPCHGSKYHL